MVAIWLEWGRREGKAGGELMPSQEEMGIRERGKGQCGAAYMYSGVRVTFAIVQESKMLQWEKLDLGLVYVAGLLSAQLINTLFSLSIPLLGSTEIG